MADYLARFSVPGRSPAVPVRSGERYQVFDPRNGLPAGPITSTVRDDGLTIVNRTLYGHVFHDGVVIRRATRSVDGTWSVTTRGIGNNRIPGASTINAWQGPEIFQFIDRQMRDFIARGTHRR